MNRKLPPLKAGARLGEIRDYLLAHAERYQRSSAEGYDWARIERNRKPADADAVNPHYLTHLEFAVQMQERGARQHKLSAQFVAAADALTDDD